MIVTHNSGHCIAACVRAVRRVLSTCEVIVVDNMSTDETVATARSTDAGIRVVQMGCNAGFGRACNRGVQLAAHDHVLLLNPDVEVLYASRSDLERVFSDQTFGLVAPELIGPRSRDVPRPQLFAQRSWLREVARMALDPYKPRELAGRRMERVEAAAWACAALLLVRRGEFLALGGFDERFFLYYEDRELGARYREADLPIRGTAAMRATHVKGGSSCVAPGDVMDVMAWCLLSWLEFVAMRHGAERARMSWLIIRRTHRVGRALAASLARRSRAGRIERKAEQLASLEAAVRNIAYRAEESTQGFCPVATRVVAGVP